MTALLLIDIQEDFLPGGALAVEGGDAIIPVVNRLQKRAYDQIIATMDWHPKGHRSFADTHGKEIGHVVMLNGVEQVLWPVHCVQGSVGAQFPAKLEIASIDKVIKKGTDVAIDSYSAFFDNGRQKQTELHAYLQRCGIHSLHIAGLATDYCVKYTVLDALALGYDCSVITDACRGVEREKGDCRAALFEMQKAGASLITSDQIYNMDKKRKKET